MNDSNLGSSSSITALGNAWASVSAANGVTYQVLGFSGGASLNSSSVQLLFGVTRKWMGFAASGHPVSEHWGNLGLLSATKESVAVRTQVAGNAANTCSANLLYRIVL